jgi:hypothetical protein
LTSAHFSGLCWYPSLFWAGVRVTINARKFHIRVLSDIKESLTVFSVFKSESVRCKRIFLT